MVIEENVRRGMTPDEARRVALSDSGGLTAAAEAYRDQRGLPVLERFWQDVRYGARMLRRSPGFTLIAVGAIGLAIGVNAGVFTLVDAMMWQPVPVRDPARLVKLLIVNARGWENIRFSYTDYLKISGHSTSIEDVVGYAAAPVALRVASGGARATSASVGCVTGNYFEALGGTASLGRMLTPEDDHEGAEAVAVVSERFWRRALTGLPDAVGRTLNVNGVPVRIVGVARSDFIGINPLVPDFWIPLTAGERVGAAPGRLLEPSNRFIVLHARLRAGLTMSQAEAELSGIVVEPATAQPGSEAALSRITGVMLMPNDTPIPTSTETMAVALPALIIVGLILVIACANLANLLLARALIRQREIAVRLALGASRGRVVRQLLTESLLMALLGCALGLLLANWTVTIASRSFFDAVPVTFGTVMLKLHASWRVFAYTILLAVLSVLTFGLAPALQSTAPELTSALKGEDSAFGTRIRRSRFRNGLVAAQVAACVVLLVAAGTLVQSLRSRATLDTGITTRNVAVAQLGLVEAGHVSPALATARHQLAARAAAEPGVMATARASQAPFESWPVLRVAAADAHADVHGTYYNVVTTRYFDIIGQRIVAGRAFAPSDSSADAPLAIVTRATARLLWPARDAVGQTLRVLSPNDSADRRYTVVGVVSDAHSAMIWDEDRNGYVYLLASSHDLALENMVLLVRRTYDNADVPRRLDDIARQVDPDAPFHAAELGAVFDGQLMPFRYAAIVATAIGFLGLGLAVIGLYGVVAFAVTQRRREFAIHLAMGAASRDVLRLVLVREMRLVVIGLAIGLTIGALEARLLGSLVIPLSPLPAGGFVALVALLLGVATLAILIPGLKSLRIAPMEVLRHE